MSKSFCELVRHFVGRSALHRQVEEELQFHIEMQALDFQKHGLDSEVSLEKARVRFGNFAEVKSQCIEISVRNSVGIWILKALFTMSFVLGVLIRSLATQLSVTQVGTALIMIGVLGALLLLGKRMRVRDLTSATEPLGLGLRGSSDTLPLAFDEEGRTPFERVKAND